MQPAIVDIPAGSDFPLENLPYGAVVAAHPSRASPSSSSSSSPLPLWPPSRPHLAVALGDTAVDLFALAEHGFLGTSPILSRHRDVFLQPTLNAFLELGPDAWAEARACLSRLLSAREGALRDAPRAVREAVLLPRPGAAINAGGAPPSSPPFSSALPLAVGDYTDFYASRHHASRVGAMFRGPGQELQPNWPRLPVGYHGRASSVVISGEGVRRPWGQILPPPPPPPAAAVPAAGAAVSATAAAGPPPPAPEPSFSPSRAVDYELEVAAVVGLGTALGGPGIRARDALTDGHLFGLVLMNDWSARDVQRWEGTPLGPFCGKNWATQVSPWVVTAEALEPYRLDLPRQTEPEALAYLTDEGAPGEGEGEEEREGGRDGERATAAAENHRAPLRAGALASYDLSLRADLLPSGARAPTRLCDSNLRHLYWSFPQMAAHHTAGGCNLRPGDLLGSGTVSGPGGGDEGGGDGGGGGGGLGAAACLLEATRNGALPFCLEDPGSLGMKERRYLQDGDEVVITGWCGGGGGGGRGDGGGGGGSGGALPRIGFGECRGRLLPALRRRRGT